MPRANTSQNNQRWNDVTIAELLFFEKVGTVLSSSRLGSMAKVAMAADISPAHLQNTLNKLEGETRFEKRLVDRKNIALLKDGELVLAYARKVLACYVNRPFQQGRATLRIAATNRILTTLLASYFSDFMTDYKVQTKSDIDIEILEATSEQVLHLLEMGEVELAFGSIHNSTETASKGPVKIDSKHPKLEVETLHEKLRMVLVAPPKGMGDFSIRSRKEGMKVTPENLANANICLVRRDERGSFDWLPEPARGYSRIIVDNYSSVIAMVRGRAAVGLLIDRGIPADLLKFEFSNPNLSSQNLAVWHRKGIQLSPAAAALRDSLGVGKRKRPSPKK